MILLKKDITIMTTKHVFSGISLAAFGTILAQPALGHAGHHGETGLVSALAHMAQSPFHLMLIGLAGGCALLVLRMVRQRNRKRPVHLTKDARQM
jgi:hypothetical protein